MLPAFQSTRPIRGATSGNNRLKLGEQNFNPRAPYGARPDTAMVMANWDTISIHAPHTGRDRRRLSGQRAGIIFQSTRPIRGATYRIRRSGSSKSISIHAPHTGRDINGVYNKATDDNFNPRAPYGARLPGFLQALLKKLFQSTRPIRGATNSGSITVPLSLAFQSTRPIRGAT